MHLGPVGLKIQEQPIAVLLPGGPGRLFSNRFNEVNSCPVTDYCCARWRSNCGYVSMQ